MDARIVVTGSITRKEKGDEQRKIVRDAVWTLGKPSTSDAVYAACQKNPGFGSAFECQNPYARVRTILQRGSIGASQAAKFSFDKIFIYHKTAKLWAPNILAIAQTDSRLNNEAMADAAD
jgi:hypothetical protein